jgi:hypothetical protein
MRLSFLLGLPLLSSAWFHDPDADIYAAHEDFDEFEGTWHEAHDQREDQDRRSLQCHNLFDLNLGMNPWADFQSCADEKMHCNKHTETSTLTFKEPEDGQVIYATKLQVGCAQTCGTCDVMEEYLNQVPSQQEHHDEQLPEQKKKTMKLADLPQLLFEAITEPLPNKIHHSISDHGTHDPNYDKYRRSMYHQVGGRERSDNKHRTSFTTPSGQVIALRSEPLSGNAKHGRDDDFERVFGAISNPSPHQTEPANANPERRATKPKSPQQHRKNRRGNREQPQTQTQPHGQKSDRNSLCYEAFTPDFPRCSGWSECGYHCIPQRGGGQLCASENPGCDVSTCAIPVSGASGIDWKNGGCKRARENGEHFSGQRAREMKENAAVPPSRSPMSPGQFTKMLKKAIRPKMNKGELDGLLHYYDRNGDDRIDYDELKHFKGDLAARNKQKTAGRSQMKRGGSEKKHKHYQKTHQGRKQRNKGRRMQKPKIAEF